MDFIEQKKEDLKNSVSLWGQAGSILFDGAKENKCNHDKHPQSNEADAADPLERKESFIGPISPYKPFVIKEAPIKK